MSFGLFPEYNEPEHRTRNVLHRNHERREPREHEYHEHNNSLRDLAGAVIVGAATIGILGMMRR